MIRPRHAIKLAMAKTHSKRASLIISSIVASLLFGILIAGIIVYSGAEKSILTFFQKANNNHYLVETNPVISDSILTYHLPLSIEEINRLKALQKSYYNDLRAKYKQLGVTYDSSVEVSILKPSAFLPTTLPEEQRVEINYESPIVGLDRAIKAQEYVKSATNKLSDLKVLGERYSASGYYAQTPLGINGLPTLRLIEAGREDFADSEFKTGDFTLQGYFLNAIHNGSYEFGDQKLMERYLIKQRAVLKGIPVVVSAQEAVALFGETNNLSDEPSDASQKEGWLRDVQLKMNSFTYQSCYRNQTEISMLDKIQRDYADIQNNKDNVNFTKPSLLYALPSSPCGDITVAADNRSVSEKKLDQDKLDVQKKLGDYVAPTHRLITFEIVGIVNAQPYAQNTDNVKSYLQNLLSAQNTFSSAVIPQQMYDTIPDNLKIGDITSSQPKSDYGSILRDAGLTAHILAFNSVADAEDFMKQETCPSEELGCEKKFTSNTYGSNYTLLDKLGVLFQKIMLYLAPAIFLLALMIIWLTMSRMMSDNRKETAVYRAMGALKSDIAAIYVTYTLLVAVWITFLAMLLGASLAYILDSFYGQWITNVASSSFGVVDSGMRVALFDLTSPLLLWIIVAIPVICMVAIVQPLVRNTRRSPINDIRSE